MKYFVVSDIHSHYDELKYALDEKGFDIKDDNHKFIICDDAYGTIDTYYSLAKYVTGENLSIEEMRNNSKKYCDLIKNDEGVIKFLDSLIDYYELGDYIFTHGYIPIVRFFGKPAYNPYWKNATKRMWDDARFYNGMEL